MEWQVMPFLYKSTSNIQQFLLLLRSWNWNSWYLVMIKDCHIHTGWKFVRFYLHPCHLCGRNKVLNTHINNASGSIALILWNIHENDCLIFFINESRFVYQTFLPQSVFSWWNRLSQFVTELTSHTYSTQMSTITLHPTYHVVQ